MSFDDMTAARAWYRSEEYAPALRTSQIALERRLLLFCGVTADDGGA